MNGTDLFCTTVTQMIDPARLAAFASTVVFDGPIVAAPILTEARHEHVLTGRYELVPTRTGVTGRSEAGEMSMSWIAIATLLAAATTVEHSRALSDAVTVGGGPRATDQGALDAARSNYAHAAATAAGLIDPPMQRQVDNGFDIELRSTTHRTTVSINRVGLFDVRPSQFTCGIDVRAHRDRATGDEVDGFKETVLFVPHGESNDPPGPTVGQRVGIERLDPDRTDRARWALQIDGFDSVIIEAFPDRGVRIAVYDNDPEQDYLRFEKQFPVRPQPSDASRRLALLKVQPAGREW